jgi:hypothetical protein
MVAADHDLGADKPRFAARVSTRIRDAEAFAQCIVTEKSVDRTPRSCCRRYPRRAGLKY